MPGTYSHLAGLLKADRPAALATVVSGGELVGAKLLVEGDGSLTGGIHPQIDAAIAADALELLRVERNEIRAYALGNARVEVFIEVFPPPQRLVIVGAVHIAIPLHRMAKMLGYHVTVIDPRAAFASAERFPEADTLLTEWPDDALATLDLDSSTSVVVLTHDPKLDIPALLMAIRSPARYIGAIGSRSTSAERLKMLHAQGASAEETARIHAPIGLNIGARSPAEIALAIMAEIVATRYGSKF